MKKLVALLLAVLMIFSLVACGQKKPDDKKEIYLIIKNIGASYWAVLQAGAQKAETELGCTLTIQGIPDEKQHDQQITMLQNAVSAGADAIVIAVSDSKSLAPEISSAFQSGIPIILVDTMVADTDDFSAAYVTDNVAAGAKAAETLIARLTAKDAPEGTIAIQAGAAGSQTIIDRLAGFKSYWETNAPEKWKIDFVNGVMYNDGSDPEAAVSIGKNFFSAYDDLIAIFGTNNTPTVGLCKALVEDNRTDITLVGFDLSPEIEALILDGGYDVATMMQNQYNMGYLGIKMAFDLANGGTAPSPKKIDTGMIVVDSTNINSDEVKTAAGK